MQSCFSTTEGAAARDRMRRAALRIWAREAARLWPALEAFQ
jgi:hypothetical protein